MLITLIRNKIKKKKKLPEKPLMCVGGRALNKTNAYINSSYLRALVILFFLRERKKQLTYLPICINLY